MELESVGLGGAAAFREVRVQSVVVEFLLTHVDVLFSDTFTSAGLDPAGPRPGLSLPSPPFSFQLLRSGSPLLGPDIVLPSPLVAPGGAWGHGSTWEEVGGPQT